MWEVRGSWRVVRGSEREREGVRRKEREGEGVRGSEWEWE